MLILQKEYFDNTVQDYMMALLIFVGAFIVVRIVHSVVLTRLKKWAEKTKTRLDDYLVGIIDKSVVPLLYFGVFYLALHSLELNAAISKALSVLGATLVTFLGIRLAIKIFDTVLTGYWLKKKQDADLERSVKSIMPIFKVVVWATGILFLLDNMGFKVSTVVAGLGIGGIAVALAAQSILGDLFSYFSIMFDRPFVVGDFVIVGDMLGTIDHIGIKTTRIISLGGEQLVFSNTDLTNSRIRNYKQMQRRRIVFKLGVTYDTTLAKMKEIPKLIEGIIKKTPDTIFDRAHFSSFGDFNLEIEVVYIVLGSDYNKYMDVQQSINFKIKEEFEKRKIEFAFPTQTLYVNRVGN